MDNGGGTASGTTYTLMGTAGQPDPGTELASSGYTLSGGFWTPGGPESGCFKVYLPLVVKNQ